MNLAITQEIAYVTIRHDTSSSKNLISRILSLIFVEFVRNVKMNFKLLRNLKSQAQVLCVAVNVVLRGFEVLDRAPCQIQ